MSLIEFVQKKAPATLILPLKVLPFWPQRVVAQKLLNRVFEEALEEGDFDFLEQQWLCIEIDDLGLSYYFSVDSANRLLMEKQGPDQARIKGNWRAFLELASRQTDPDTLFFQRKLSISGDTDLCHGVKNLLDALELGEKGERLQRGLVALNLLVNSGR